MAEKIIQARKRSADPNQEIIREQKSSWNSRVSQFISKMIAFKRSMNGKGDERFGLPSSNIKNPVPPEVPACLRNLAAEYASIVHDADYIIKSQNQYSTSRRRGKKEAEGNMDDSIIVQASWWGSRLWSRFGLHALPKEIRKLRLEMLRSANYMYDELNDIEDKLYSKDITKTVSGINQLAILSFGFLKSFLRQYNQLIFAYRKQMPAGLDVGADKKIEEQPTAEEKMQEEGMQVPKEEDAQKRLEKHTKSLNYIEKQLIEADIVINYMRDKPEFDQTVLLETNTTAKLLLSEIQKFDWALKTVGSSDVLKMSEWANNLIRRYKEIFTILYNLMKDHIDLSTVKENNFRSIVSLIVKSKKNMPPSSHPEPEEDLSKNASGIVSRWINRKLLRMSPSSENDIKFSLTGKLITVIHKFDEVMDIVEDKNSTVSDIEKSVLSLIDDYSVMLSRLQVLAKIIYLKQDEVKFTEGQPILKLKSSIVRDLGTVIEDLKLYQNAVET